MFHHALDVSVFNLACIRLAGELGKREGGALFRKMRQLLERQWVKIVLDFGEVEHIHYTVLAKLLQVSVLTQLSNGGIKLAHVSPYHRRLLELAGVHDGLETYDTVADAILSFDVSPPAGSC